MKVTFHDLISSTMRRIILFCLPYAGGNKYSYRQFESKAPSFLELRTLEYPGRGGRIHEPLMFDINALVDDLYREMESRLSGNEYAIYGHSMGGLIACLLSRKIVTNDRNPPLHLFITGTSGPSSPLRKNRKRHLLDRAAFFDEVKKLNGSPDHILENEEMLDFIEPILRADFCATETYIYESADPLRIRFTVITGTEEDLLMEDIKLWQRETTCKVDFEQLKGGHFFIYDEVEAILRTISNKILNR